MHRFFTGYANPVVPETKSRQENISGQRGIKNHGRKKETAKKNKDYGRKNRGGDTC
jgi:hypothetical protein